MKKSTHPMKHNLALVTGASSGIGLALCELLADQGIALIIHGRDLSRLENLAKKLRAKVTVQVVHGDLADPEQRRNVVEVIRQQTPDLIVNNAGIALYDDAIRHTTEQQLQIVEVNNLALLELTLEGAKALSAAQKQGVIMNISSVAGFFVFPCFSVYAASKCFVTELSQSLDYELRPQGIRVLVACPGMVDTNFRTRSGGTPETHKTSVMTAEYAAKEIWKQIQTLKPLHIFNWKYRLAIWIKPFIPQSLYARILMKNIKQRCT